MRYSIVPVLAVAGTASASAGLLGLPLLSSSQIKSLLSNLGPAPASDPRFSNWVAPGPNDVRGPCPGLNTAANHGFIHHDGRDLNIPDLITGLASSMNIGPDFSVAIGAAALTSSPNILGGSFTLADIAQHNFPIEHDASISRKDAYFGDDSSFNQAMYSQYFDTFGKATTADVESIANAKYTRYNDSLARNPTFTFGPREFVLSYGENALWAQVLSDASASSVRLDYAKYFFTKEKFPTELGWTPSKSQVNLLTLGNMIFELYSSSPQAGPQGQRIVQDSYKDLFEVLVGGSENLFNLTQGISGALGL